MTTRFLVDVLVAAAFVVSCQRQEIDCGIHVPKTDAEFVAVTEAGLPTRMTLGTGLKPEWDMEDRLAVYDGTSVNLLTVTSSDGGVAVFKGQVAEGASEFHALFPHSEGVSYEDGAFRASIPVEQFISAGDSVSAAALMAMAYTTKPSEGTPQFSFRNVCGLIKVDVPESGKISSIVITSNGDETFAGEGTVALKEVTVGDEVMKVPVFTPSANASGAVTLRPEGEAATFEAGSYYAAVAPVEFKSGFSINMVRTDGASGTVSTDRLMTVVRNGGTNLKDVVAISDWKWLIMTKEQLLAWNNGDRKKTDYVELGADIDLEGETWVPHDFTGVFDGKNHKIYNISMSRNGYCGFVAALDGTIQNLCLGTSDGTTYDGKSEFAYVPTATVGSWVHMGSVAAAVNDGAVISNVTNFVKISVPDSDGTAKVCMGGLVSMGTGTCEIKDCVNYGEIVCDASKGAATGASNHQIGGIMCKTDGNVNITNCRNYGNISAAGAYVDNVGGIMANPNGNGKEKAENTYIKDCYNYGNITITKTASQVSPMALGGIVGKLTGATIENCHNEGNISSVCDVLTGIGGVAGIHNLEFESKVSDCSNGVQNASDKGLLTFNPANGTQQMVIGGVLGYSEHSAAGKLTVQGCDNYAPINVSYGKFRNVGGICGVVGDFTSSRDGKKSGVELLIDDCHNHGNITVTSASSYTTGSSAWQKHIGGVVGILYGSDAGVTVSNSSNDATIHSTATGDGETRLAGIVAHTRHGKITISSCENKGEVKATGAATNPRPAGIVSVTNAAAELSVSNCYNKGKVTYASTTGTSFAGGVVAYLLGPATISECYNQGELHVTAAGGDSKVGGIAGQAESVTIEKSHNQQKISFAVSNRKPMVGGIVGNIMKNVIIEDCHNEGNGVVECTSAGNTVCLGGIAGRGESQGIVIRRSSNSCEVKASVTDRHLIVGGILGVMESGNATGTQNEFDTCTNSGKVTVTPGGGNYARVGGIAGFIANATNAAVNGCTNETGGEIYINGNNTNYVYAGGMVGHSNANIGYSNNTNRAKIGGSSAGNYYVGGIWGYDAALGADHTAKDVTGNVNYGELYGTTASGKTHSVGGLFGAVTSVAAANLKTDNASYGNVACAGGALAGTSKVTWHGLVGNTVTVNGVAGTSGTPEPAWLCPAGDGIVTADYVEAPAN